MANRWLALMVACNCALGCKSRTSPPPTEEHVKHDAFARAVAADAGASLAFNLASSDEVHFEWGFSDIEYDPSGDIRGRPFRWISARNFVRLHSHGDKPMRIVVQGWANRAVIGSTPTMTLSVDGTPIVSFVAEKDGAFGGMGIVPPHLLRDREWVGLTVDLSSVIYHWVDAPTLKVALVGRVEWSEWVEPK